MKATDILVEEHIIIKKVLECLQKIAIEAQNQGKLDLKSAQNAIDFFKNFADLCHHSKEEDCLFPVLEENGFQREGGPTGVMFMEHVEGRNYIQAMNDVIEKASEGDVQAIKTFKEKADGFFILLDGHIQKENHCLFSMADRALNDDIKDSVLQRFKDIELDAGGQRHTKYIQMAKDLCQQYGVELFSDDQLGTISSELI